MTLVFQNKNYKSHYSHPHTSSVALVADPASNHSFVDTISMFNYAYKPGLKYVTLHCTGNSTSIDNVWKYTFFLFFPGLREKSKCTPGKASLLAYPSWEYYFCSSCCNYHNICGLTCTHQLRLKRYTSYRFKNLIDMYLYKGLTPLRLKVQIWKKTQ